MANCSYKEKIVFSGEEWECPCEALPEEEFCYWHKREEDKELTQEMLEELKEKEIFGVYLNKAHLQNADLVGAKLQNANLMFAELRNADLWGANLQHAYLNAAKLQNSNLRWSKLQNAYLGVAEMQNANLSTAEMQNTNLSGAKLQHADLRGANLQNGNLKGASLQGTNLHGVRFDSETSLEDSILYDANLFRSYFDEAKSFRHAKLFRTETDKEINEIIGDALGKKTKVSVLDLNKIEEANPNVATEILDNDGLVRYARDGTRIVFFDKPSKSLITNPEIKDHTVIIKGLSDLIHKGVEIQSEYLYAGSRADQFEASYEVYNNLYNFYANNGRLDQAAHVHYRRGEAHRKLLKEKGGLSWLRSWIFDFFVLRLLTGYGDKIERPIGASATLIALFAVLFRLTNGIVKTVNGELVSPEWLDYFYHSITTFTSLGYSNIQPNLAVSTCFNLAKFKLCIPLPQILVAAESVLGILLMALIIFVVTYQVSR